MNPEPGESAARPVVPGVPLLHAGGQWVLTGSGGDVPVTDPDTAAQLDALTAALAAADQAIAAPHHARQAAP